MNEIFSKRRTSITRADVIGGSKAERIDRARPLGAFLFFPGEEPTAREAMPLFGCHSLTSSSFRLYAKGLREVFAELPDLARGVLTEQHQYVSCHCFRIVGRGGGTVFVPRGFWADQALTMLRLVPSRPGLPVEGGSRSG